MLQRWREIKPVIMTVFSLFLPSSSKAEPSTTAMEIGGDNMPNMPMEVDEDSAEGGSKVLNGKRGIHGVVNKPPKVYKMSKAKREKAMLKKRRQRAKIAVSGG